MSLDLDALERLLAAATPRPWEAMRGFVTPPRGTRPATMILGDEEGVTTILGDGESHDAALIVAAVNALPELIAEVRRLRAENARLAVAGANARIELAKVEGLPSLVDAYRERNAKLEELLRTVRAAGFEVE